MNYITLNQLKSHLNIDSDFTADDSLLEMYGDVAEAVVQRHLCILLSELVDGGGVLPPPIRQAILFYAGKRTTLTLHQMSLLSLPSTG